MAIQTATVGDIEKAQNTVISQCRYTAEYNAPCVNLIDRYKLAKGQSTLRIPKVGQATATNRADGEDIVDTQDIGLTYTDLTSAEVGLKFILTYKLINQFNEDVFKVIGRQMGDAMARKRDRDVITLFASLSNTLGADNATLGLIQASACVAYSFANKFPNPISFVHHPNAIANLCQNAAAIGTTYYAGILGDLSPELLRNFWRINVSGVNFFQTGNIDVYTGASGYGAILSKSCLAMVEGWAPMVEREKDISMRAWEVVMTSDYGVFEVDDDYGAKAQYEIGTLTSS